VFNDGWRGGLNEICRGIWRLARESVCRLGRSFGFTLDVIERAMYQWLAGRRLIISSGAKVQ
jgi:hypothetical protein